MSSDNKDSFDRLLSNHLAASPSVPLPEPCPDANWTAAYLEGSLNATFRATFERHLANCRRCQTELASLLKAGVVETEAQPAAAPAASSPAKNLLATLWHWTKAPVLRPAFAVLLVSVLTQYERAPLLCDSLELLEDSEPTKEETPYGTQVCWSGCASVKYGSSCA